MNAFKFWMWNIVGGMLGALLVYLLATICGGDCLQ